MLVCTCYILLNNMTPLLFPKQNNFKSMEKYLFMKRIKKISTLSRDEKNKI